MSEQISIQALFATNEDIKDLERQAKLAEIYLNHQKRARKKWENAFQKWSNEQALDGLESYGCCGYGSMCDWCEDNTYGRPCVRALNAMCRETGIKLDYSNYDFKEIW